MSLRQEKAAKMCRQRCVSIGRSSSANLYPSFSVPVCLSPSAKQFHASNVTMCQGDINQQSLIIFSGRSVSRCPMMPARYFQGYFSFPCPEVVSGKSVSKWRGSSAAWCQERLVGRFQGDHTILPQPTSREDCKDVPRQECEEVPRERCADIEVQECSKVPRRKCQTVPKVSCNLVPRQVRELAKP